MSSRGKSLKPHRLFKLLYDTPRVMALETVNHLGKKFPGRVSLPMRAVKGCMNLVRVGIREVARDVR